MSQQIRDTFTKWENDTNREVKKFLLSYLMGFLILPILLFYVDDALVLYIGILITIIFAAISIKLLLIKSKLPQFVTSLQSSLIYLDENNHSVKLEYRPSNSLLKFSVMGKEFQLLFVSFNGIKIFNSDFSKLYKFHTFEFTGEQLLKVLESLQDNNNKKRVG